MKKTIFLRTCLFLVCCLAVCWAGVLLLVPQASWTQMIPGVLAAWVACLPFALLFSRRISGMVAQPIQRITNHLEMIQRGNYNVHIDTPYDEELTPIVGAINTLTQNIARTLEELTYEKEKAEYILNNMDGGLVLVDARRQILQYNNAIHTYFNVGEEVVGSPITALTDNRDILGAVDKAIDANKSSLFDVNLMDKSGMVVSVRVIPAREAWTGGGRSTAAILLLTNVTQMRQMERMRSEFVANVSHELKTPITSIKGFAELLDSGVVQDRAMMESYLGRIREESERMTNLIEDILRISSLESGENPQQRPELVDLREMTEDILYSLTPQISKRHITTLVEGEGCCWAVPDDMRQLLKNLIENAVKYNVEEGRVSVVCDQGENSCSVTVSDTGIGIPMEHQPRIFERFYRVDKGRSKREGGTGLGLSIVKHVVAKYGGKIRLNSRPDEGTEIQVTLPVGESPSRMRPVSQEG